MDAQLSTSVKRFSLNFMKNTQIVSLSQGVSDDSYLKNESIGAPVSPVPRLINSNDPPSDEERVKIDESLFTARQRLSIIQCRAGPTEGADRRDRESGLERIQNAKSVSLIQAFIKLHEAIKSPLRTLPVELLQLIFELCLAQLDLREWRKRRPCTNVSPFPISQVCQRWRQIAHNTPQLWSSLGDIEVYYKTARRGPCTTFYYIDEFLRRSRGEDLSLNICASRLEYPTPDAHPLIELLLQHSERWANVTIDSTWITVTSILYNRIKTPQISRNQFPRLRRLGIVLRKEINAETNGLFTFKDAPILEDLYIYGSPPRDMGIPIDNLLQYRQCAFGSTMAPLGDVMDRSKNLKRLEVIAPAQLFHGLNVGKRLNYLTVLHLKVGVDLHDPWAMLGNWSTVKSLIQNLTVPSLEELKIAGCLGFDVVAELASLVRRSQCNLRRLCLSTSDAYPKALHLLLELTPQLEALDADIPSLFDLYVLASASTVSPLASPAIPKLKHLILRSNSPHKVKGCASFVSSIGLGRFNARSVESDYGSNQNKQLPDGFRLVFPDQEAAVSAQIYLYTSAKVHNASPTMQINDSCSGALALWRSKLHEELPLLDGTASAKRRLGLGFPYRLNKTIGEIENFEAIDHLDLPTLLASKVHLSLHQLGQVRSGYILGDSTHNIPSRSRAILAKWESHLKNDIGHLEWALVGSKSLVFIPEGHSLRRTRAVIDMICGIKDDLPKVDLDWTEHM